MGRACRAALGLDGAFAALRAGSEPVPTRLGGFRLRGTEINNDFAGGLV